LAMGDPEKVSLTPSCRLSNGELRGLLKASNHGRTTMLSPSAMTSFPYRVVSYDEEWMERWLSLSQPGWDFGFNQPADLPIMEDPIPIALPVAMVSESPVFDDSWEDSPPPSPVVGPTVRHTLPPPHPGRIRARQARANNIAQGLHHDNTPKERTSRWSRKY
jgi:hypothetical protein